MKSEKIKAGKVNTKKGKKMAKKEVLTDLTEGLLLFVTEVILVELFFGLNLLVSGSYSGSVYRASKAADEMLGEILGGIDPSAVKQTCRNLKREGFVTYVKGKKNAAANARLTKAGLERIRNILPQYRKERPWDGRLYLITYDVPEERRKDRDLLRHLLKKFGCGLLQKSVWVTPHNPKGVLEKVVKDYGIVGDVIVSDTGNEGSIGNTNFKELMARVYNLEEINGRYSEYIEMYRTGGFKAREQAIFKFLSVVEDDPQLPYELLPTDWFGDEAYSLYEKFI